MAALRIIWVGKTKAGFPQAGVEEYLRAIQKIHPIECTEIRAAAHSGRDPAGAVAKEGDAILKKLNGREKIVLLDEKGSQPTSRQLAKLLAKWLAEGAGTVTFVLGGAFGVDARVRAAVQEHLSLSRLTLPHQLARVMLLEQLYRSLTLNAGHAYHHE